MVVNPGEYVGWKVKVATASGRKTAAMDIVVWNLSNPAGANQISTTPGNTFVVDDDNNYNTTDVTPDAISLVEQVVVSNEPTAYSAGTYFTISGINTPITLRFTRDSLTETGLVPTRRTIIGKSTNGGVSYSETNLGAATGAFVDLTASAGDRFFLKGYVETSSGRGQARWRNIVTNQTTGQVLGSAFVDITVDDDNNYNVADITPDPIAPSNQTISLNADAGYTAGASFTISGINAPITLRFSTSLSSTSGNVSSRQYVVGRTTAGGAYSEWFTNVGSTRDVTVNNGDTIVVKGYLATSSGVASSTWSWTASNQTAGGTALGGASITMTADADNNYNVADITPNAISPSNQSNTYSGTEAFNAGTYFTISGINTPITLRFTMSSLSLSGEVSMAQSIAGRTTSGYTEHFYGQSKSVDIIANNGDQFFVKGYVNGSGPGSASWNWTVRNQSAGVNLATRSISITLT